MLRLPVPLVLAGAPAQPVLDALAAERIPCYRASAAEAAGAAAAGWAELVVVSRFPGWSELAARLEASGATVVLLDAGGPLGASRATPAPGTDVAASAAELPATLWRAEARRAAARSGAPAGDEPLLERLQNAERVSRFAQAIATQLTLPDVVGEAIARTCELCDADGAALLRVDADTGELVFEEVAGGAGERIVRARLAPGEGVAGKVAQGAAPLLVRDALAHPDVRQVAGAAFRTASLIAVPLLLGGDVLGVLEAVRGEGRPPFDERHLQRLQRLAPHVTIAVHNAQLTDSLRRSQTEVLAANGQLEQRVRERTAQIGRAKQEWEQTFDAISEPIALLDGFVIRRANQAYARAARRPVRELPGRRCHEVLAGRDAPCPGCPLAGRAPGSAEVQMPAREATFAVHGFALRTEGDAPGGAAGAGPASPVVVHYRDVTAERRLEAQLRESERMAGLGQLASGAAHEINNPLGFVMANLRSLGGLLDDLQAELAAGGRAGAALSLGALTRDGRGMVQESLAGAQRVAAIVKGLRELSRQQVARVELTGVEGSVRRAVREAFGPAAADVQLQLSAVGRVRMSPLQLDQALANVLRNARQAVEPARRDAVTVTTRDEAGAVVIEVRDAGCGIPAEHLRRVFEPFFTTRGIGGGVGLGLTAAYGAVQRHGGSIDLQSAVGEGTTVRIRLPAHAEPEAAADVAA